MRCFCNCQKLVWNLTAAYLTWPSLSVRLQQIRKLWLVTAILGLKPQSGPDSHRWSTATCLEVSQFLCITGRVSSISRPSSPGIPAAKGFVFQVSSLVLGQVCRSAPNLRLGTVWPRQPQAECPASPDQVLQESPPTHFQKTP